MEVQVQVNQVGLSTSEGIARTHKVFIDRPEAKGGQDKGAMGGELLLMSFGGCFISNLLAAIRARKAEVAKVRIRIIGTLESAPPRFSAIEMKISADYSDKALMEKLVNISEKGCIVANTLKNAVALTFTVE
ncbi:MAG: OsmC family protein [bacterium]|nr:OsmC family protein [bacterium]